MTTTPSNRSIHDHTNLSETAQTDTIQPEPLQTEPLQTEPLQTEPLQTESVQTTEQPVAPILVRPAEACDAPAVCEILVEAFPTLYEWTFGKLPRAEMVALLHHLYEAGCLISPRHASPIRVALLLASRCFTCVDGWGTARFAATDARYSAS